MKTIIISIIPILLYGCGAGTNNILNPQPNKYVVESTSTSLNPGTLEVYQYSNSYSKDFLANEVATKVCLPKTPDNICSDNKSNLESDFGFNLGQITSGYDIDAYAIQYNTPGVYKENRSVSGGVLIPKIAASQIKGIILYFHETEVSKNNVPSCFKQSQNLMDYCLGNVSDYGGLLGGVLASQGYIVVMPDYIGQGFDKVVMHPYALYAKENAVSGLNMLIATNTLLSKLAIPAIKKDLYIAGFSEGGAYSLWASNIIQNGTDNFLENNNLELKDTVGISGAYDLANAQMPMEADNVKIGDKYNISNILNVATAKPILTAYTLTAFGFYNLDQEYNSLFQSAFLRCTTCLIDGKTYTVPDLFTIYGNSNLNDNNIKVYLDSAAAITGYAVNGDNSAKALLGSDILDDKVFTKSLIDNSITKWNSNTPVQFVYLNKDSVVTNLNSVNAYNEIEAESKSVIIIDTSKYKYMDQVSNTVEPVDHVQAAAIKLIATLQQFKNHQ